MEQPIYIRRGHIIVDPDGNTRDHKTINAAKKASRDLQKRGHAVRVEALRKQAKVTKLRAPKDTTKFSRPLTQDELAEIAGNIGK